MIYVALDSRYDEWDLSMSRPPPRDFTWQWTVARTTQLARLFIVADAHAAVELRLSGRDICQGGRVPAAWYGAQSGMDGRLGQPLLDDAGGSFVLGMGNVLTLRVYETPFVRGVLAVTHADALHRLHADHWQEVESFLGPEPRRG